MCVTFPESLKYIKDNKGELTGTPIREDLLKGDKERGRKFCNFKENKKVLMIIGGSLGSKIINESVRKILNEILKEYNVIHLCGKGNLDESLKNLDGYRQYEYISEELPDLMALADLVISRAGANTIFELLALRKLNILIPLSANASRGDQVLNANSFEKSGYSMVIKEEELNSELLLKSIKDLEKNREKYLNSMKMSKIGNGVNNIIDIIKKSAHM